MFLTQHFVGPPRWTKEWLPLATQQLRLRNLIKILAFGITNDKKGTVSSRTNGDAAGSVESENETYYFTLHSTTMSAPFYTSEKLTGASPKWKELETSSWGRNISNSVDAVVIRLWFSNPHESDDKVLAVWGIHLSGLLYLGPKLRSDMPLTPNSVVLQMPGGYFTDPNCIETNQKLRYASVIVKNCDVRPSYSVSSLKRLQTLQHVIKKEMAEADMLKKKISMGDFFRNETRGRTTLRKLLSKHKHKTNQVDLMRVKENIEITRYRVTMLREEKDLMLQRIRNLNSRIQTVSDSNKSYESTILENVKTLRREIHNHKEWRRGYIDRREKYLHSKAMLNFRKKQLISELNLIYPIVETAPEKFTICGVHLPNSEDFAGHDDLQISVALGFVTHVIQMISVFLQIPLRYPVVHYGSRSRITDHITDEISDSEREFCLYSRGKEKLQFRYAVYLLNKNIAQMRWLCGLPTSDLRNTLENLSSLVKIKVGSSNLDQSSSRSLSSSTADICGSNVSVSSLLGSVASFQLSKKLTENRGEFQFKTLNCSRLRGSGHRFSKSVGSSKEFRSHLQKERNSLEARSSGNNGLSCSLDEGLNDFEENVNEKKKKDLEQFGSEPTLHTNVNNNNNSHSSSNNKYNNEEKVKNMDSSVAVQTWTNAHDSPKKMFGEDETNSKSEINKPKNRFKVRHSSLASEKSDVESAAEVVESDFEKGREDNGENAEVALVSTDMENVAEEKIVAEESKTKDGNVTKRDLPNSMTVGDSLLESVTNRTEALVHQTTSFNRFRTRFKSTLESSN